MKVTVILFRFWKYICVMRYHVTTSIGCMSNEVAAAASHNAVTEMCFNLLIDKSSKYYHI
jgi:hypothetical protein